ncbi:GTP-binding protein [Plantactinospora sp. WMMC1484]|uniref:GTP-binding protein n=1 Tax=Plantactinospora sp. WMMC1484 TaxID=3404122 RepID=UPI003BF536F9
MDRKSVKVVVAGGFGTGKTTLVGSVSEIPPLTTEELLTQASVGVDDVTGVEGKTRTTVALDFGRITITSDVVLYLFGTPGQDRFWFIWDELAQGAVGAVVLIDTRRLDTSFPAVDYFERRGIPFVAAVNRFFGECLYTEAEIRSALKLDDAVPLLWCDARDRESSKRVLIGLVRHALARMPVSS